MHGHNITGKPRTTGDFVVHNIWHTLQGEGPWSGYPAIFVRFAHCNLHCFYCDTEFDSGYLIAPDTLATYLRNLSARVKCRRFVLTGGEPMLQQLPLLLSKMLEYQFQVETAGSVWPEGLEHYLENCLLVCSPKTPSVHRNMVRYCRHWKYILRDGETDLEDGLPSKSTQIPGKDAKLSRPAFPLLGNTIWVQPCDEGDEAKNAINLRLAVNTALKHNYRLSLQTHKIVGVD